MDLAIVFCVVLVPTKKKEKLQKPLVLFCKKKDDARELDNAVGISFSNSFFVYSTYMFLFFLVLDFTFFLFSVFCIRVSASLGF